MPDEHPLLLRQGFENIGDVGGVQLDKVGVEFCHCRLLRRIVQLCRPGHDGGGSRHQDFNELVDALNVG